MHQLKIYPDSRLRVVLVVVGHDRPWQQQWSVGMADHSNAMPWVTVLRVGGQPLRQCRAVDHQLHWLVDHHGDRRAGNAQILFSENPIGAPNRTDGGKRSRIDSGNFQTCPFFLFKFVGWATGISVRFVPFRILPTRVHNTEHRLVERNVGFFDHGTPFFRLGLKQRCKFFRFRTDSHHADVL